MQAEVMAAELTNAGFAVAGVSIRSSAQVQFPVQGANPARYTSTRETIVEFLRANLK